MDFADEKIEAFTSDLRLDNVATRLTYRGINAGEESRFNKIAGRVKWEKLSDGQEIQGENLQLVTSDDLNMKSGKFSIRDRLVNNQKVIKGDVHLDEIQLETLSKITAYFDLPSNIEQAISETEPTGKFTKLTLTWLSKGDTLPEYALTADFSELGLKPYSKFSTPGFTNLSGKVKIDEAQGKLDLQTKGATLKFPGILRWPVPADSLAGEIKWQAKGEALNVDISRLFIKNAHFNGEVDGSYKRKNSNTQYIDLTARANNVDLQHGRFYYPTTISKDTVDWLDTSILSGRGENVNLILRGDLKDYPWNGKNGLFKVTAKINNAVLDHSNGWPKIEGINLDMLFEGKRMELNATSGHAFGNQIKKAKITIPDLMIDDNVLDVVGEAQGLVPEAVKYVNNSPIEKMSGGFTDYLKTSGNGKLLLNLHIPLTKVASSKVKGSYTITNGSMQSDSIPELTKLNGSMDFTESSINVSNAIAYGGPAQFSINTDKNHSIQIVAKGHVVDTGLRKTFGTLVPSSVTGGTDWSARAQVANNKTDVSIRSNLIGINSTLPFPARSEFPR